MQRRGGGQSSLPGERRRSRAAPALCLGLVALGLLPLPAAGQSVKGGARVNTYVDACVPIDIEQFHRVLAIELGTSIEVLRREVTALTDWRGQINGHRREVLIGAAVAGFVIGGGIAGVTGILFGRRKKRRR